MEGLGLSGRRNDESRVINLAPRISKSKQACFEFTDLAALRHEFMNIVFALAHETLPIIFEHRDELILYSVRDFQVSQFRA